MFNTIGNNSVNNIKFGAVKVEALTPADRKKLIKCEQELQKHGFEIKESSVNHLIYRAVDAEDDSKFSHSPLINPESNHPSHAQMQIRMNSLMREIKAGKKIETSLKLKVTPDINEEGEFIADKSQSLGLCIKI